MTHSPIKILRKIPRIVQVFAVIYIAAFVMVVASAADPSRMQVDQNWTQKTWSNELVAAAMERTRVPITYDGSYRQLDYPMGDVDNDKGVCTDVIIRSYRALGVDLQQLVHEDMKAYFAAYPKAWGLSRPDSNIDHRRVLNLETFFQRHGETLAVTKNPDDYQPGDIVTWRLGNRLPHIGIVTDKRSLEGDRPMIVHNVGAGTVLEDVLLAYPLSGHYRYQPEQQPAKPSAASTPSTLPSTPKS